MIFDFFDFCAPYIHTCFVARYPRFFTLNWHVPKHTRYRRISRGFANFGDFRKKFKVKKKKSNTFFFLLFFLNIESLPSHKVIFFSQTYEKYNDLNLKNTHFLMFFGLKTNNPTENTSKISFFSKNT